MAQITLADLARLVRGWKKRPPPNVMLQVLASAYGWKPAEETQPFKVSTPEEWMQFASAIGAPVVKRGG